MRSAACAARRTRPPTRAARACAPARVGEYSRGTPTGTQGYLRTPGVLPRGAEASALAQRATLQHGSAKAQFPALLQWSQQVLVQMCATPNHRSPHAADTRQTRGRHAADTRQTGPRGLCHDARRCGTAALPRTTSATHPAARSAAALALISSSCSCHRATRSGAVNAAEQQRPTRRAECGVQH